jgi:hypothetical protein
LIFYKKYDIIYIESKGKEMINMKLAKAYALSYEESVELVFTNESERNEMALAFWQEGTYERFMYEYNHYGAHFEEDYLPEYMGIPGINAKIAMWTDRLILCSTVASERLWTYDATLVAS